jgi:hypothetical protein
MRGSFKRKNHRRRHRRVAKPRRKVPRNHRQNTENTGTLAPVDEPPPQNPPDDYDDEALDLATLSVAELLDVLEMPDDEPQPEPGDFWVDPHAVIDS